MTRPRKAPADSPSTLKDPDYQRRERARRKAEDERYAALCGPVVNVRSNKKAIRGARPRLTIFDEAGDLDEPRTDA